MTEKSRAPQSAGALPGAIHSAPFIGLDVAALGSLLGAALRLFRQLQLRRRASAGPRPRKRAPAKPTRAQKAHRPSAAWPWAPPRGKTGLKGGGRHG